MKRKHFVSNGKNFSSSLMETFFLPKIAFEITFFGEKPVKEKAEKF
jgi:hypothetical protein